MSFLLAGFCRRRRHKVRAGWVETHPYREDNRLFIHASSSSQLCTHRVRHELQQRWYQHWCHPLTPGRDDLSLYCWHQGSILLTTVFSCMVHVLCTNFLSYVHCLLLSKDHVGKCCTIRHILPRSVRWYGDLSQNTARLHGGLLGTEFIHVLGRAAREEDWTSSDCLRRSYSYFFGHVFVVVLQITAHLGDVSGEFE